MNHRPADALPRVLICDPIHADGQTILEEYADVDLVEGPSLTQEELAARIGQYHAVINRSRTSISGEVIRRGKHLQVIARAGVGLDNIDVQVAHEQGVKVVNCPSGNSIAVAEHTLALILALARHIPEADRTMKASEWAKSRLMGTELSGKTLGIVGFGSIGREVAIRAKAFDMRILVNQNRLTPELAQEWRVENVDLYDLLAESDFVTLHVPMRATNVGLIGGKELAHMKPSAYLINTSRGGIVDEDALLQALDAGTILGAGLDVFRNEPNISFALAKHPHVIASPHIGASTEDAQRNVAVQTAQQVVDILNGPGASEVLGLQIVPVEKVFPHERYHGPRVDHLAERIVEDGFLANPPIVAALPNEEGYVVLDGATRTTSFRRLNYPHIVVQVVDLDNVHLFSWNHVIRDARAAGGSRSLLELLRGIEGLVLQPMAEEMLNEALHEQRVLGYLRTIDAGGFLLQVDQESLREGSNWLDVLDDMVAVYGQWGDVERTLYTEMRELKAIFPDMAGLAVFPAFSPDVILQVASQKRLLPAGVTRFVIPGRILRINVPLNPLVNDDPLSIKRDWLDRIVHEKLGGRNIRYYEEPVVLLDE